MADDEPSVLSAFSRLLESDGYEVEKARNGREAVDAFAEHRHDLVLLDCAMPVMNGVAACEQIRAMDAAVPILFFTASASDAQLVRSLGAGGDDFIDKMCGEAVFLARVRRAMERSVSRDTRSASLRLRGVDVDLARMKVFCGGEERRLSRYETDLLALLASEPGRVFSTDEVIEALHGEGCVGEAAAVRMLVRRLRAKLGAAAGAISAVRGAGYALAEGSGE